MTGRTHPGTPRRTPTLLPAMLPVLWLLTHAPAAWARDVLLGRDEALALAFPGASIRPERVFLTADQQRRAAEAGNVEIPTRLIARYLASRDGVAVGRAYVDTHVVRTKRESLLISLGADGRVSRIDVVAFLEPEEYGAPPAFLDQYRGRSLSDDLHLQRAIRPIAGATLTARAVNIAARRVLAIDTVLGGDPTGENGK